MNNRNLNLSEKRNYVPAFSNFENMVINEGSELSTDMEKFIAETLVFRAQSKTDKIFKKSIDVMLSDPSGLFSQFNEVEFLSTFKSSLKKELGSGKSLKEIFGNYLYKLGNEISKSYPEVLTGITETEADGASKQQISTYWKKYTPEKNLDTPKTDIIIQRGGKSTNLKISIKNVVSQFMSGEKKETKATIYAAIDILKENKVAGIQEFTKKADAFINNMITIKTPVQKITFTLDGKTETIELNSGGLSNLRKRINSAPLLQRPAKFKEVAKTISADAKKQLQLALEQLDTMDKAKDNFANDFVVYLNKNIKYKEAIIYEAASGHYKFNEKLGGSSLARADYIIVWNNNILAESNNIVAVKTIKSFKDVSGKINSFGKIKFDLAFKSNSIKKKIDKKLTKTGYSMFSALRIGSEFSFFGNYDEKNKNNENQSNNVLTAPELLEKILNEDIDNIVNSMLLNESLLEDINSFFTTMFDKIKTFYNQVDDAVEIYRNELQEALNKEFTDFLRHMDIIIDIISFNEFIESENNTYGEIFSLAGN
jgi:hypothetical protein